MTEAREGGGPSRQDQIVGAEAAAKRAEQAGDLSPRESKGVLEKLRGLRGKIARRNLDY